MSDRQPRSRKNRRQRRGVSRGISIFFLFVIGAAFAIFTGYLFGQWWAADRDDASVTTDLRSGQLVADVSSNDTVTIPEDPTPPSTDPSTPSTTETQIPPATQTAPPASTQTQAQPDIPAFTSTAQTQAPAPVETPTPTPAPTTPQPTSPPATLETVTSNAPAAVLYRVQVGRFSTRDQATDEIEALKRSNPPIEDAFIAYDDSEDVFRVQVGAFRSPESAREMLEEMESRGLTAVIR